MQPTPHDDLTCPNYREVAALRKRVEEIERERDEARAEAARWLEQREELAGLLTVEQERSRGLQADLDGLIRLNRAMLDSQGELIEEVRGHACCKAPSNACSACNALARAERVRRGEV